jgi:hypothetical protein
VLALHSWQSRQSHVAVVLTARRARSSTPAGRTIVRSHPSQSIGRAVGPGLACMAKYELLCTSWVMERRSPFAFAPHTLAAGRYHATMWMNNGRCFPADPSSSIQQYDPTNSWWRIPILISCNIMPDLLVNKHRYERLTGTFASHQL